MNTITRFAAPARDADAKDTAPVLDGEDRDLDVLCERWVSWCRTRRLYGPAPLTGTILGKLSGKTRPVSEPGGPDAICSAELSAFHIAYTCQPDAIDKRVFDFYYVHRIKPIKAAAGALGISRKHFYTVLGDFRKKVHAASELILQSEAQKQGAMQLKVDLRFTFQ